MFAKTGHSASRTPNSKFHFLMLLLNMAHGLRKCWLLHLNGQLLLFLKVFLGLRLEGLSSLICLKAENLFFLRQKKSAHFGALKEIIKNVILILCVFVLWSNKNIHFQGVCAFLKMKHLPRVLSQTSQFLELNLYIKLSELKKQTCNVENLFRKSPKSALSLHPIAHMWCMAGRG